MKRNLLFLLTSVFLVVVSPSRLHAAVNFPVVENAAANAKAPYLYAGQLLFDSGSDEYVGSGTVIGPAGVLTAGHNVFDPLNGMNAGRILPIKVTH